MQQKLSELYAEKLAMEGGGLIGARKRKRAPKKNAMAAFIKALSKPKRKSRGRGYIGGEYIGGLYEEDDYVTPEFEGSALIGAKRRKRRTKKRKMKGKGSDEVMDMLLGGARRYSVSETTKKIYDTIMAILPKLTEILEYYPPLVSVVEIKLPVPTSPGSIDIFGKTFTASNNIGQLYRHLLKSYEMMTEELLDYSKYNTLSDREKAIKGLLNLPEKTKAVNKKLFSEMYPTVNPSFIPLIEKIVDGKIKDSANVFFLKQ